MPKHKVKGNSLLVNEQQEGSMQTTKKSGKSMKVSFEIFPVKSGEEELSLTLSGEDTVMSSQNTRTVLTTLSRLLYLKLCYRPCVVLIKMEYGLDSVSPNEHGEVFTPTISGCDLVWRQDQYR